jgi:hypothetical protein
MKHSVGRRVGGNTLRLLCVDAGYVRESRVCPDDRRSNQWLASKVCFTLSISNLADPVHYTYTEY